MAENNKNMRELYKIYLELWHEVFEEKFKNLWNFICIANDMEKSKLGEVGFDENDLFSPPNLEEKIYHDDNMHPTYDDYNDEYGIFSPPTIEKKIYRDYDMPPIYDYYNNGYDSFTPTIINENDYTYMESNNTFMIVDHENNDLCDGYIVEFIQDATESYYEGGRHGSKYLNNIKFPLFMLKVLKLHLLCLLTLVALWFNDLFSYKIPMHVQEVG